jgi:predicted nucleic acid-binding protein
MMFILDTNVLSELMNPEGAIHVQTWIDSIRKDELFTTALNQAEILYGIAIMAKGRKRERLIDASEAMFRQDFRGRILPFDERAAGHFADITARRKLLGNPVGILDSQVAAIARAYEMTIVTRNTKHFQDCDVPLMNPWHG